jgi:two-component sensor histidine kinase
MLTGIDRGLRANAERLRDLLCERVGAGSEPEAGSDAQLLLDALCAEEPEVLLPRFEASARHLAEQEGRLDARMAGVHRCVEALGRGIDEIFAAELAARTAAQARLRWLVTEVDGAFVRGFQAVLSRQAAEETERAARGARHLQTLQRINAAANSSMDLAEALQITARAVAEDLDADLCAIFLFDEMARELQLRATNGPRPRSGAHFTLPLGEGYSGWVAEHGHPLLMGDACSDAHFGRESTAYQTTYHGLVSMPIIYFTVEKLVGVLSVQTIEPREFSAEESGFLEVVAGQLAMNIENGRLYEQTDETLRRKVHELSTLHRVSALVASTLELEAVLQMIVEQAVQLSGADRSIIFGLDPTTQRLRSVASYGFGADLTHADLAVGECCAGRAVQTGEPSLQLDCMRSDDGCCFRAMPDIIGDQHAVLCVPLVSMHGSQGALCIYSSQRYLFDPHQLQLVVTFANVAAIAMENARLFEQTREGLETKGLLLREMHHRVKNNLQQVGSILSMQRRRAKSPQVERILAESVGRIQGIAATHDLLSRENLGMAAIDDIVRKIVDIVRANLVPPHLRLELEVEPCPWHVPSEQATTLAIMVNELIANAIEHGFEGRVRGRIHVSGELSEGNIVVRVADDGAGPPAGFDLQSSEGLGLQLVRSLVQSDLHGTFRVRRAAAPAKDAGGGCSGPLASATEGHASWTVAELCFPARLTGSELGGAADGHGTA